MQNRGKFELTVRRKWRTCSPTERPAVYHRVSKSGNPSRDVFLRRGDPAKARRQRDLCRIHADADPHDLRRLRHALTLRQRLRPACRPPGFSCGRRGTLGRHLTPDRHDGHGGGARKGDEHMRKVLTDALPLNEGIDDSRLRRAGPPDIFEAPKYPVPYPSDALPTLQVTELGGDEAPEFIRVAVACRHQYWTTSPGRRCGGTLSSAAVSRDSRSISSFAE